MLAGFASAVQAADGDGAISLRSVLLNRSSESGRVAFDVEPGALVAPTKATAIVQDGQLVIGSPSTSTPVVTPAAEAKLNPVRRRDVLLTSGQDAAATVRIPELLPPPVPGLADLHVSSVRTNSPIASTEVCQCQTCRSKRGHAANQRRGVGQKFKAGAKRVLSCFIEVEECDEVHFDVDEYHMPILLVAAKDESAEPQESESPGAGLLSRKLTDIQPTLAYAYGEQDERALPESFYKKVDQGVYQQQVGPKMVLQWEPTNLWYYPLYFQDTGLERYGHTHKPWVQPFVSTGKFFGQVVTLPYRMTLDPPTCPQYSLGYYQPGEWAPKKKYQLPFNEEAAATQFLWMTGFFLLIP